MPSPPDTDLRCDRSVGQRLICIGGLPGSGKTTLGRALARRLSGGYTVLDPDAVRLELLGRAETDVVTDDDMTPAVTRDVINLMALKARTHLQNGGSLIVASAFVASEMRQTFEALAKELDVAFTGLWLDAPVDALQRRLLARDAMRASGIRDATTISAVSGRHVANLRIDGSVTWPRIDGVRQASVVLADVLTRLQTVAPTDRQ